MARVHCDCNQRVRFTGKVTSLGQLRDWYCCNCHSLPKMLGRFKKLELDKAIHDAAAALCEHGRMYSHQRRNGHAVCKWAADLLLKQRTKIKACKSFEDLVAIVKRCTRLIPRFKELSVYDTALRIGANLDIFPDRVYLHCGAKAGARNLQLKIGKGYLEKSDLPIELRQLPPHIIENFFCVCKKQLRQLRVA